MNRDDTCDVEASKLTHLKESLEAERHRVSVEIRRKATELTVGEPVHEVLDVLQAIGDRNAVVDRIERLSNKLAQVESSLRALSEGRYGYCADCEEPISMKRLAALPWATLCVKCQTRLEEADSARG